MANVFQPLVIITNKATIKHGREKKTHTHTHILQFVHVDCHFWILEKYSWFWHGSMWCDVLRCDGMGWVLSWKGFHKHRLISMMKKYLFFNMTRWVYAYYMHNLHTNRLTNILKTYYFFIYQMNRTYVQCPYFQNQKVK